MEIKIDNRYFATAACEPIELFERRNIMNVKPLAITVPFPAWDLIIVRDAISRRLREAGIPVKRINTLTYSTPNCKICFNYDQSVEKTDISQIVERIIAHEKDCKALRWYLEENCHSPSMAMMQAASGFASDFEKAASACIKKMTRMSHMSSIKEVIYNPPATIVLWADGTKTVVKAQKTDTFDCATGLAMAIAKKHFGNDPYFNEIFRKFVPDYDPPMVTYRKEPMLDSDVIGDLDFSNAINAVREKLDALKLALETAIPSEVVTPGEEHVETCRERLKREYPELINEKWAGGCLNCPDHYGYAPEPKECHAISSWTSDGFDCGKCWDRPVAECEPTPLLRSEEETKTKGFFDVTDMLK